MVNVAPHVLCVLKKKRQTFNQIDSLKDDTGEVLVNDTDILAHCVYFYKKLYSSTNPDIVEIDQYLEHTHMENKLDDENKTICEGLVSIQECQDAIKQLKDNKSPGIDGLPAEFYKTFLPEIESLLVDSFNESFI